MEGEYSEYSGETLSMGEIAAQKMGSFNYQQLVMDALCAVYWSKPLEERPAALYWIICKTQCRNITLEALMQMEVKELKQLPEFLKLWISYLGTCKGGTADRLLAEALALQNDFGQSLEMARAFSVQHPEIYEQILRQNLVADMDDELFQVGQEALLAIQPQYTVRSRVALLTAVYALRLNHQKEGERCWLSAFQSDTRPVNYLRLKKLQLF